MNTYDNEKLSYDIRIINEFFNNNDNNIGEDIKQINKNVIRFVHRIKNNENILAMLSDYDNPLLYLTMIIAIDECSESDLMCQLLHDNTFNRTDVLFEKIKTNIENFVNNNSPIMFDYLINIVELNPEYIDKIIKNDNLIQYFIVLLRESPENKLSNPIWRRVYEQRNDYSIDIILSYIINDISELDNCKKHYIVYLLYELNDNKQYLDYIKNEIDFMIKIQTIINNNKKLNGKLPNLTDFLNKNINNLPQLDIIDVCMRLKGLKNDNNIFILKILSPNSSFKIPSDKYIEKYRENVTNPHDKLANIVFGNDIYFNCNLSSYKSSNIFNNIQYINFDIENIENSFFDIKKNIELMLCRTNVENIFRDLVQNLIHYKGNFKDCHIDNAFILIMKDINIIVYKE